MLDSDAIREALENVRPRTPDVRLTDDVRVGRDATDDDAVWVYVVVPDHSIKEFNEEWGDVRGTIRQAVRNAVGNPELFVYIRMRAESETTSEPPSAA